MKMRTVIFSIISSVMVLLPLETGAGERFARITASLEWGSTLRLVRHDIHCFRSYFGYLVPEDDFSVNPFLNGEILGSVGVDLGKYVNISLYGGYEGIDRGCQGFPISLRTTVTPIILQSGAVILNAGGGVMIPQRTARTSPVPIALGGIGYRFFINRILTVDLLLGYRFASMAPVLTDPDTAKPVPQERILRNDRYLHGLNLSIALHFRP
jgi:hypothetical protein